MQSLSCCDPSKRKRFILSLLERLEADAAPPWKKVETRAMLFRLYPADPPPALFYSDIQRVRS